MIGRVVLHEGRVGVVIDAWPLPDPEGCLVRFEPLIAGEVVRFNDPSDLVVVPLRDRRSVA
jgi:hypothetical protein